MDYKRNREYFEPVKYGGVIALFIIGSVLLLIGLTNGGNGRILFAIWGILLIALAIVLIVLKKKRVVTDEEYDASVAAMLTGINVKALNKLGLDKDEVKEIAPISFDGYVYSNATHLKKGEDQLWRTNRYESTVLFFSENEVHCYTYTFDTTCAKQTEKTDVYFYKDIVSVTTATETVKVLNQPIESEYFKLTTAGGTALSVSLRNTDNAQRSINAMRSLLRAKKMA